MPQLWITRTRPQRPSSWEDGLGAAGWQVERLEVLATTPRELSEHARTQLQEQAADSRVWLWTSAAAVAAASVHLAAFAGRAEQHAVGHRTAAVVQRAFAQSCAAPHHGHGGAAWVAEYGAGLQPGDRLLLLTGNNPRQDWLEPLRARGVCVSVGVVYDREAIPCAVPEDLPDAVIATSGAGLESLSRSLQAAGNIRVFEQPLLLPAARLKTAARRLGWSGTMAVLPALTVDGLQAALKDC